jgi:O-antigen ligase
MNLEFGLGLTNYVLLGFYLAGFVALMLTVLYRIEIGLVYLTLLLPQQNLIDRLEVYPLGSQVVHFFVAAIALKWIVSKKMSGEPIFCKTLMNWPLLAFIVFTFFGLWWGTVFSGAPAPMSLADPRFVQWKNLLIPFVLYFATVNMVKSRRQVLMLILAMTLSMLAMDRSFYAHFFRPDHYTDSLKTGGVGAFTYLGANELAAFYAMYSPMMLSLLVLDGSKLRKVLYGIAVLGNYYSLVFLFSRGGYFAMLAGLLVLGLLRHRVLLMGVLLMLVMWRSIAPSAVIERVDMTWTVNGIDRTTEERLSMWRTGIALINTSPVLGVGFSVIPSLGIQDEVTGKARRSLHNGYVTLMVELGIIGMGLWVAMLFCATRMAFRLLSLADGGIPKALGASAIACVVAAAVFNITSDAWSYFSVMGFFWITFALVARSIIIFEEERSLSLPIEATRPGRINEMPCFALPAVRVQ